MTQRKKVERVQLDFPRDKASLKLCGLVLARTRRKGIDGFDGLTTVTGLVRFGLRAVCLYERREHGDAWFIGSEGALIELTLGDGGSAAAERMYRYDAGLGPEDQKRLVELQGTWNLSYKRICELALGFAVRLSDAYKASENEAPVVLTGKRGRNLQQVSFRELNAESFTPQTEPNHLLPLGQSSELTVLPRAADPCGFEARQLDVDLLYGILLSVTASNRHLALKTAQINQRARSARKLSNEEQDALELEYDLTALLEQFWYDALEAGNGQAQLKSVIEEPGLLPRAWCELALTEHRTSLKRGKDALIDYVNTRLNNLQPFSTQHSDSQSVPLSPKPRTRWRHWTRSRSVTVIENGVEVAYREIYTPLEWTAVLHHYLAKNSAPSMSGHDVQLWLTQVYQPRYSKDFNPLVATCERYNIAFYGRRALSSADMMSSSMLQAANKVLDTQRLEEILANPDLQQQGESERAEAWTRFIYLWLNLLRVVRPVYCWDRSKDKFEPSDIQLRFRSATYADATELRARIFGAQTSIHGLRWILRGGILPRRGWGRLWLLHGAPGSGKSTFALHLAADMARRGRVSVFVCSEERADAITDRLVMFGLYDEQRYRVIARDEFEAWLKADAELDAETDGRGILVIYSALTEQPGSTAAEAELSLTKQLPRIARYAEARTRSAKEQKRSSPWKWLSVIVDSFDAVHNQAGDEPGKPMQRQALQSLVRVIEASRCWGIFLSSTYHADHQPMAALADTVVELATAPSGMQRTLQIHKCRTQPFDLGPHVIELLEGTGAVIYPNLASVQRSIHRRARRELDHDHVVPLPSWIQWPGGKEASGSRETELSFRRGATILFHGPAQSGKLPFLLNTIAQRSQRKGLPEWRLGASGAVLFVSFRGGDDDVMRPLVESPPLARAFSEHVSDIQLKWYAADESKPAAPIVLDIQRHITRSRRDGLPLDWIVFSGVEAVKTNFLSVHAEKSFWPTILALTASEQISTAFLVTDSADTSSFVDAHRVDMDYVLRFEQLQHMRTVTIEKSADPPPINGYPVLMFDLADGRVVRREPPPPSSLPPLPAPSNIQ